MKEFLDKRNFTLTAQGCKDKAAVSFDTRVEKIRSDIVNGNPLSLDCPIIKTLARYNVIRARRGIGWNRTLGNPKKLTCMESGICFHHKSYRTRITGSDDN